MTLLLLVAIPWLLFSAACVWQTRREGWYRLFRRRETVVITATYFVFAPVWLLVAVSVAVVDRRFGVPHHRRTDVLAARLRAYRAHERGR